MISRWAEIRDKLLQDVYQSLSWKVYQSMNKVYEIEFPGTWSWISQDEWMAQYNQKLKKLKDFVLNHDDAKKGKTHSDFHK